jgi:hypothetical protein
MAYRIVAKSPEKLDDILTDIKDWFASTKDYVSKFETEKRKFADPATKQIVSKDIDVIYVKDPMTKKETKIMLIPLLKPGEMKVEMGGENEHVMKGKIKNMMKGRGDFKTYNKDTLRKMEAVEALRSMIREEYDKILSETAVSMPLGAPGSKAKVTIKETSPIGDVSIEVRNDAGKVQVIDVLRDHIPYIVQALESFLSKTK